jgi:hypothetical protein
VTTATLADVKAFLAIRMRKEFKRPKRPLIAGGDLVANGVDAEWIAFVDGLSDDAALALLQAADFLKMEDLQVRHVLSQCHVYTPARCRRNGTCGAALTGECQLRSLSVPWQACVFAAVERCERSVCAHRLAGPHVVPPGARGDGLGQRHQGGHCLGRPHHHPRGR